MKQVMIIILLLSVVLLAAGGCDGARSGSISAADVNKPSARLSAYTPFVPARIEISPLTGIGPAENSPARIKAFVNLMDSFGSQIKWPATFRFELYQHLTHSSQPKGQRIFIWPDIDLTAPAKNNDHWRDFLRAYEFNLDLPTAASRDMVLYVTGLCPGGTRLSAEFILKNTR